MLALIEMLGNLLEALGEIKNLPVMQQIELAGYALAAGAGAYALKQDYAYAAMAAIGAVLVELRQLYQTPPGKIALPADHPTAQIARKLIEDTKWDPLAGK